tara:strand:- start:4926 stop:5138 length:213 start_codon:yes stop_codon:yes gene_type:complete
MTLRAHLKKQKTVRGRRWTIKKDANGSLTHVKMIFKPDEYEKSKKSKTMYGDKDLLKILDKHYEEKTNNS